MLRHGTDDFSRQNLNRFASYESGFSKVSHSREVSVEDTAAAFVITVNFSHLDETSLDLWVEDHQLTLSAYERAPGSSKGWKPACFLSSFDLPSDIDEDSIKAEIKEMELKIRFQKETVSASTAF
ncbi:MAG TPA: Hsp20/alpha crystallin family protein [Oligoflexus sp.]|uniref:Hsp20/alpha crystallin family protein n=1 Tax=Oligoflexus sp. TaxID=1971216 RepID=UPI002D7FB08F|nr:Hsp20/alpha crystallin family protein [Oligoflexus sp.]HET9237698.1 Hsp20/alpha crystallin family protein [Oligoflexus sp.]